MGTGYEYKCKKCGYEYSVSTGIGFLFLTQQRKFIKDIKRGKYGLEWKTLLLEEADLVMDASKILYVCKSCGNWKTDRSISLYSTDKDGHRRYVKSYIQKCKKCGRMRKIDEGDVSTISLSCPKCRTENEVWGEFMWD